MKYFLLGLILFASTAAFAQTPVMRHSDVRLKTGVRLHYVEQGDPKWPTDHFASRVF
jgi:hypothetical protein